MTFVQRHLRTPEPFEIGGRWIKPYHVGVTTAEIEAEVLAAARRYLPRLLPELDETPPAGFVVVHRGADATYLNAYTWVWDNVIECRTAAAGAPFLGCPDADATHFAELTKPWIGCVWELPPLEHERSAWVRHMLAPDRPDLDAYLADRLPEGLVGGPS